MEARQAIWQISGGPASRSYADVFLPYSVGLLGPGDPGRWRPDRSDEDFDGGFVRRFASEMQKGDMVLLRTELSKIRAVGVVASDYEYLNQFDDVNGWGLQHARRIRYRLYAAALDFAPVAYANLVRLKQSSLDSFNRLKRP